jgi:hypothetical protein
MQKPARAPVDDLLLTRLLCQPLSPQQGPKVVRKKRTTGATDGPRNLNGFCTFCTALPANCGQRWQPPQGRCSLYAGRLDPGLWTLGRLDAGPVGRLSPSALVVVGTRLCGTGWRENPLDQPNDQRSTRLPVPDEAGQGGCQIAPSNFESLSSYARNRGPHTFVQSSRGNAKGERL